MEKYSEYEIIYSYIPELASCIDSYRDSIISPDDLTKDTIPIKPKKSVLDEEDDYEEKLLTDYKMKMPIYVPKEKDYDLSGINYRLNNYYIDKRNNWNKINTLYVEKGKQISEGSILLDELYDLVCFNNI